MTKDKKRRKIINTNKTQQLCTLTLRIQVNTLGFPICPKKGLSQWQDDVTMIEDHFEKKTD